MADTNMGTLTYKVGLDLSELSWQSQALVDALCNFKVNVVNNSSDSVELKVSLSDAQMESMEKSIKSFSSATGLQSHIILGQDKPSKYNRPCKGITLDVYDVLQSFAVTNPATQHAIKKLLCAGLRGHKDKMQDLTEALKSIERAIELEK